MCFSGGQQHIDEKLWIIHVGDGFVQGVHDEQGVILKRLTGAEIRLVHGTELLEHRHHVLTSFEQPAER